MNYDSAPVGSAPGEEKNHSGWLAVPAPPMRLALAAVLLVAVAGFSWMAVANRRLRQQLDVAQTGQADAQRQAQQLRQAVADLRERAGQNSGAITDLPTPGAAILSLALAPDLVRSGGQQQSTLHLSTGISEVHLLLRRDHDESATYYAVLETAEGSQVWRKNGLAGRPAGNGGKVITVQISPSVLKWDDYVLRLFRLASSGRAEDAGTYSFRVVK